MNFWGGDPEDHRVIKKPILILAPMEDVTDTVFRQIVASCGRPDVFFTEFTNTDGICSVGFKRVVDRLKFSEKERPIVAQIWGTNPEYFYKSAQIIAKMGLDGIDINMGCPVKDVVKTGACSALIKNHKLAKEIIEATKKGAPKLPISIKTRIGFESNEIESWVKFLLECQIDALTLHLRTAKEMSKVPSHWDEITKAIKIRDQLKVKTLIIGNGDILTLKEAHEKCNKYGLDGIMIGRAIFDNSWIFNQQIDPENISQEKRFQVLLDHVKLFESTWGKTKDFNIMKKFFKSYIKSFEGASELRAKLMTTTNGKEVKNIIDEYLKNQSLTN